MLFNIKRVCHASVYVIYYRSEMFDYVSWQQVSILDEHLVSPFLHSFLQLLLQTPSWYWCIEQGYGRTSSFLLGNSKKTRFSLGIFDNCFFCAHISCNAIKLPVLYLIENWPSSKLSTIGFGRFSIRCLPTKVEMNSCKVEWNHLFLCIIVQQGPIPFFIRSNRIQQDA